MSGFKQLHLERVGSDVRKTRTTNVALKIGKDCRLNFEWCEMFGRYVISLNKLSRINNYVSPQK